MSIVLSGLTKNFGGLQIVNGVNLEIQDGELFVLLGGSGSGKSTILRMIAGLAEPDSGSIHLHGKDVTRLPPQARNTGFVFQNYSIFRHMTIAENIQFGLRVRKVPMDERRRKSDELMELVGLTGLGQRYPSQLSGGQQQRVALARALAYEPSVLLLDEPFGALDVKIRGQLRRGLRDIQQQLKVTAILVTHDQEEGFELGDRIGVLEKGNLMEVGSPEQLYHRPSSQFVATFVGGGNLLVGTITEDHIQLGSRKLPLPEGAPAHLEGARARILIRPENLEVLPDTAAEDSMSLGAGQVVDCVFAGPQRRVRIEMEELQGVRAVAPPPVYGQLAPRLEATLKSTLSLEMGERVAVRVRSFHVLERTGLRSLIIAENSPAGELAINFGLRILQTTGAPATLLAVGGPQESEQKLLKPLEEIREKMSDRLPNLRVKVRRGAAILEILAEVRHGMHEMVVLGEEEGPTRTRLRPFVNTLLKQTEVPVLLVQQDRPSLRRILICTGAGEPGKGDVWMGGRMAKRANATVTVVHVCPTTPDDACRTRAMRHLDLAKDSLRSIGVEADRELLTGDNVADTIQIRATQGDFDLIVLGIPENVDMVTKLVRSTTLPVLFVPLSSG
jgi:sulfate/thiosulfate transport system ATP-binding protein